VFQMLITEWAAWSKLLRENFVICLLSTMYASNIGVLIHMNHDGRDQESINFMREVVTGVGGCLFGMLTKNTLSGRGSGEPAATTTTTTTVRAEGGPVPPVPPVTVTTTIPPDGEPR
jgi:hypothetical protein